jgi:uncharacterized protein (DUF433 family)
MKKKSAKKRITNIESARFGEGIYSPIEVAEILKLPYHKVKYLIRGYWDSATFGAPRNKAINFLGLIEFYFYYFLRVEKKWTSQAIKRLHTQLSSDFSTPYPFASLKIKPHKRDQRGDKMEAWIDHDGQLIQGDGKLQASFRELIEPFLDQIEYGDDLLAKRFYPLKKTKSIVIDPKKQFGKPIISGKGVRTEVVYRFFLGGESKEGICKLYNLDLEQVENAILYHDPKAA